MRVTWLSLNRASKTGPGPPFFLPRLLRGLETTRPAASTMAIALLRISRSVPAALVLLAGVSSRPEKPIAHTLSISSGVISRLMTRPPRRVRRAQVLHTLYTERDRDRRLHCSGTPPELVGRR